MKTRESINVHGTEDDDFDPTQWINVLRRIRQLPRYPRLIDEEEQEEQYEEEQEEVEPLDDIDMIMIDLWDQDMIRLLQDYEYPHLCRIFLDFFETSSSNRQLYPTVIRMYKECFHDLLNIQQPFESTGNKNKDMLKILSQLSSPVFQQTLLVEEIQPFNYEEIKANIESFMSQSQHQDQYRQGGGGGGGSG